jgi:hypothetical protein
MVEFSIGGKKWSLRIFNFTRFRILLRPRVDLLK